MRFFWITSYRGKVQRLNFSIPAKICGDFVVLQGFKKAGEFWRSILCHFIWQNRRGIVAIVYNLRFKRLSAIENEIGEKELLFENSTSSFNRDKQKEP